MSRIVIKAGAAGRYWADFLELFWRTNAFFTEHRRFRYGRAPYRHFRLALFPRHGKDIR